MDGPRTPVTSQPSTKDTGECQRHSYGKPVGGQSWLLLDLLPVGMEQDMDDSSCSPVLSGTLENAKDTGECQRHSYRKPVGGQSLFPLYLLPQCQHGTGHGWPYHPVLWHAGECPKTPLRKARKGDSLGFCWIYCLSAWNRAWMDD